jgi:hypothetical protein
MVTIYTKAATYWVEVSRGGKMGQPRSSTGWKCEREA